jgi:tRNA(Ile)-lysidine synthase
VTDALPGPMPPGRTRDELVAEVRRALAGVPPDATVLVAVSGGPDSTACAFLTAEARPDLTLHLGHVRHGLRDDRFDVAAVTAQASFLGAPLHVEDVTVEADGRGVEAAARSQRYAALRRMARAAEAGWILVAHTADDQAETVLLRLARGTGVPGLAGIPALRGDVLRPLLRLRREDVHRFVALEGLPSVEDPTNRDIAFARNLVRHEILPLLGRVGPDVVGALARLADLARDDARALDAVASERGGRVIRRIGRIVAVPLDFVAAEDPATTRRVLRQSTLEVRGGVDPPTATEVETLRHLTAGAVDLPGVVATAAAGWLALAPADLEPPASTTVAVPGRTSWPATGWTLVATADDGEAAGQLQLGMVDTWRPRLTEVPEELMPPGGDVSLGQVVLGGLDEPVALTARPRIPGDRIQAHVGTRKLQDVLVDAGVPRHVRDQVPIVVAGRRVLWVPGVAVDERARLAGLTTPQVHLAVAR